MISGGSPFARRVWTVLLLFISGLCSSAAVAAEAGDAAGWDIKRLMQETWSDKYGGRGFLAETNTVVSPLKLSNTAHFFDFTEKLKELFSSKTRGSP